MFNAPVYPPVLVSDFRWSLKHEALTHHAQIHGVCAQTNVGDHLQKVWAAVNSTDTCGQPVVEFRLCIAHVAKNWSTLLKEVKGKAIRKGYMWMLAKLAFCQTMEDVRKTYIVIRWLCPTRKLSPCRGARNIPRRRRRTRTR